MKVKDRVHRQVSVRRRRNPSIKQAIKRVRKALRKSLDQFIGDSNDLAVRKIIAEKIVREHYHVWVKVIRPVTHIKLDMIITKQGAVFSEKEAQ